MTVTTPHLNTETEHSASRLLTKDIVGDIIRHNIMKGRAKPENINLSKIRENII